MDIHSEKHSSKSATHGSGSYEGQSQWWPSIKKETQQGENTQYVTEQGPQCQKKKFPL